MTRRRTIGRACALLCLAPLALGLASCRTITVEPAELALPRIPAEQRPALDFDLRYSTDAALAYPDLEGRIEVERLDGEDLAAETAPGRPPRKSLNQRTRAREGSESP